MKEVSEVIIHRKFHSKIISSSRTALSNISIYARLCLTGSNLLQLGQITVEDVIISTISVAIRFLPDGLIRPAARYCAGRTVVVCQNQRAQSVECARIASALFPPVCGAVDHGIRLGLGVISIDEILNPGNHCGLAQAVAGGTRRVILDIQHARKSPSITGPSSSVGEEEVSLSGTGAFIRVGKVIAATNEACFSRTGVVRRERGINVGGPFGSLDIDISIRLVSFRRKKILKHRWIGNEISP